MVSISETRQVGPTGLDLPVFGFGSAHIGELYAPVAEADSRATLQAAWDGGVRYYDTAPWYGRGLAEHRLGGFLRTRPRDEFLVTTKVGRTLHRPADPRSFDRSPWIGGLNFEVRFDYSRDGIMRSYEQALQRLALDTVDALIIHDLDAGFHGEGETYLGHRRDLAESGIKALEELKKTGDIKAFGMGINTNEAFETVAPEVDIDFLLVAMPYTLADQASLDRGMADCVRRGVSVIIGAPFASGILVTGAGEKATYAYGAAPTDVQDKVRGIGKVARAHGVALPAAALQFPLAHPAVVSIIPGAAHPDQIRQNLGHVATPIPTAFWSDLKAQGLLAEHAPTPDNG
ncbi:MULTISPECIES: aldo/keto reductase [unclassified Roseitalea]|uniref:aldo/keto reductase n=1 Tax=unclassified Roseitalea TaxID=2639107 RepID=UPI0027400DFF|nr:MULTISPECIES: aldo/keto reductase [unclassified Roseitalea]